VTKKILENKPLVEAIFELKWDLRESVSGMGVDPYYKLLIGRIYERIKDEYPFHEQLPTATMPDELAAYMVQHRFRKNENGWPLIQVGPGIITFNDTEGYTWENFKESSIRVLNILFETYPDAKANLNVCGLLLRYIDAITFDFGNDDILTFLKEQLKTEINLYQKLFEETDVSNMPLGFDMQFSFSSAKPNGTVHLRFDRGKKEDADALMWETIVQSVAEDIPQDMGGIVTWMAEAHDLTDDWFFKLIEGELQTRLE